MVTQFMDKLRSFLGFDNEPPRNDFRNPIWGSDDDDDGDELYTKQNMNIYSDPMELHREFTKQIHDMFKTVGNMFGDMKTFFDEADDSFQSFVGITDMPAEHENIDNGDIREFYLRPGYRSLKPEQPIEDKDLDGEIHSHEISGLLKRKNDEYNKIQTPTPFNGNLVTGKSFCQTVITTSIKKPDGTVETRRIVKNGNEVIEETTTTTSPDVRGPNFPEAK